MCVRLSEHSNRKDNSDSERVGNTDWCECEVCVSLSERERFICDKWDILEEKRDLENVDCKYNTGTLTLPESFRIGNLLCCIQALD